MHESHFLVKVLYILLYWKALIIKFLKVYYEKTYFNFLKSICFILFCLQYIVSLKTVGHTKFWESVIDRWSNDIVCTQLLLLAVIPLYQIQHVICEQWNATVQFHIHSMNWLIYIQATYNARNYKQIE